MSWQMMRLLVELGLSLHFFIRLRVAYGGGWWQAPVLAWVGLMLAPMFLQRKNIISPAVMEALLWLWPLWLGFLIIFTVSALFFDISRLGLGLAGSLSGKSWWGLLTARRAAPLALALALALSAHAYYTAYTPRLKTVEISTNRLPEGVDELRIVHLTDVHLSGFIQHENLKKMAGLAVGAKPDILVFTGDLVDTDMGRRGRDAELLASIKPRYGSYAVLGNHESYAGLANAIKFYEKAGLKLLRGQAVSAGGIVIAGVDDEVFGGRGDLQAAGPLLAGFKNDKRFVLFLKHRPAQAAGTEGLYDLQLSGHTHGGQIFPGHLLIFKANGYLAGLYELSSRNRLYISRGAGFWGLPMRFLAPPEVTLVRLTRASKN